MTMEIEQARDRVPRRVVRLAGLAVVAGIAASIGATLLLGGVSYLGAEGRVLKGPRQIETAQFDVATEAEVTRTAVAERLRRYGWVDRGRRLVHVPIDVATQLFLADPGAKAPAPETPGTPGTPEPPRTEREAPR